MVDNVMNFSVQLSIPIFNGQNYDIWSVKMKTLLRSQELWDMVEKGYTEPNDELRKNRKSDATALFLIQQAMDDDIFPRISAAVTSKEAWEILKQEYCSDRRVTKVEVEESLISREFKTLTTDEGTVQEMLSRVYFFVNHTKQLMSLGDIISRETVVSGILRNLDSKFNDLADAIAESGMSVCSRETEASAENKAAIGSIAAAPEGSENAAREFDANLSEPLSVDDGDFFTSCYETFDSFDAMGLQENLLRGIYANGFEMPFASQQKGIVPFCKGLDVILQGKTGTGKTATFCVGILQQLDYSLVQCQALVLVRTKALGQQIEIAMLVLGDYLGVKVHVCVGGTSDIEYRRILQRGVHVIVGTPKLVFEMLKSPSLPNHSIRMLVLDEADELFSRSLKHQKFSDGILQHLPSKVQVGVFSATLSPEVLQFCRKFMNRPVKIELVMSDALISEGVNHFYVNVEKEGWKLETLCELYETLAINQSIIFVNTKRKLVKLADQMRKRDHTVSATHGGMDKYVRDIVMGEFRSGSSRVLISTDLWTCGIDVQQVSLIINYDFPSQPEKYLPRLKTSGPLARKSVVINFVTTKNEKMLSDIQRLYNVVFEELPANISDLI